MEAKAPPYECDLCGKRTAIAATFVTPNTVSSARAAEREGVTWFEDPDWASCEDCKSIVVRGTLDMLVARSLTIQEHRVLMLADIPDDLSRLRDELRGRVRGVLTAFWNGHTEMHDEPGYRVTA